MHTVTRIPPSVTPRAELGAIMADYFALERLRIVRRLLVVRLGGLALATVLIGRGFDWLSPAACAAGAGMFLVPLAWVWLIELRTDWQLARRLESVPGAATHVVPSAPNAQFEQGKGT